MPTTVQVVPHQGRTALAVDGQVIPGMSYTSFVYSRGEADTRIYREMVESGIKIYFCPWNFHQSKFSTSAWTADDALDFAMLDDRFAMLSAMSDDLWFIPRLYLDTPHWWAERYPEELVRYADNLNGVETPSGEHGNPAQASMASQRWRADITLVLHRFVEYVENGPYADRVLGYMLNSGGTEEWVYWGAQQGRIPDYSTPAEAAFRQWLLARYGSLEEIARAWHDPSLSLDEIFVPDELQRRRSAPNIARDPRVDQPSIDYDLFLSDLTAEMILHCCATVKEASQRRRVTGTFYGYLLWQTGLFGPLASHGHIALRKLLDSPEIDFITGITSYDNREPGGPGSFMLPVESVQATGKLVFNEVDVRTHLTSGINTDKYAPDYSGGDVLNLWPLKNPQESVAVYRREFSHQLIHGAAWWYFDMEGKWYSCPEMREEFAKQSRIIHESLGWNMSSISEVAGIVSGPASAYQRFERIHDMNLREWADLLCDRATANLYEAGLPIDWWLMDDLGRDELRRYKVLYFHNATFMSNDEIAAIERLKSDGRTLIFIGLPGLVGHDGIAVERASAIIGMHLRLTMDRMPGLIDLVNYSDPVMQHCEAKVTLGTGAVLSPCLEIDDPECRILGRWRVSGQPGAAVKDFGNWRSIYFPVPPNHAALLQGIARSAGCHIWYKENGIIFANRSLLVIHTLKHPQTMYLPQPMTVTDLFTDQVIARDTDNFIVPGAWGGVTSLFKLDIES